MLDMRVLFYHTASSAWIQIGPNINGTVVDEQSGTSVSISNRYTCCCRVHQPQIAQEPIIIHRYPMYLLGIDYTVIWVEMGVVAPCPCQMKV